MKKILLLGVLAFTLLPLIAQKDSTQLVTTWRTYNAGNLGDSTVLIYADTANFNYNFDVDWDDDGIFDSIGMTHTVIHQYPDTGTYTIRIRGNFPRLLLGFSLNTAVFNRKLVALEQWGTTTWQRLDSAFFGCLDMEYNATDSPDLSAVADLSFLFAGNFKFNGNIGNWNVSGITNMESLFSSCTVFNQDISAWDVGNVTNMRELFIRASAFNQQLNTWDVSQVTDMSAMFTLSGYNQPLNQWNVGNVTDFSSMFGQSTFNQPIGSWNVSSALNMSFMFSFSSFNQSLNSWSVDSVNNMLFMFKDATAFNQDISNWNIGNVTLIGNIFDNSNLSRHNYDQILINWAPRFTIFGANFGGAGLKYCLGDTARSFLINTRAFTFMGDTLDCLGVGLEEELAQKTEETFSIYPNPARENLNLTWDGELFSQESLLIYNLQGKLVQQEQIRQKDQVISIANLPNGLYLIRWGETTQRLVVSR